MGDTGGGSSRRWASCTTSSIARGDSLGRWRAVRKDQELELTIDSLAYGGNGVARLNGFVVFVRRGLPGDTVRARVTNVKRNHAEALALEVVEPGARASRRAVRALPRMRRVPLPGSRVRGAGRREGAAGAGSIAADRRDGRAAARADPPRRRVFHYRNKLEYSFTQTPCRCRPSGFHKAGRWDEVLDIERCWLTTELGNAIRHAVRDWARAERLAAYDQAEQTGYLRHLVVREGRNSGQALVYLVTAPGDLMRRGSPSSLRCGRFPEVRSIHWSVNDRPAEVTQPPDAGSLGGGRDRGGAARPALPRPPERIPADEHRDGREPVRARALVCGADGRGDRLRPVLRHRHDRADVRARGADGVGGGGCRRSRSRARSRTPS